MIYRIPFRDLEDAIADPIRYRAKLERVNRAGFGDTYSNALRDAIFRFHRSPHKLASARQYLSDRLAKFSNSIRKSETLAHLDWYADEYKRLAWAMFDSRLRVVIPQTQSENITCSGQVARLDMVPSGGYAAWMLRSQGANAIFDEICMPLIQLAIATVTLGVAPQEVRIGIYSFNERFTDLRSYSSVELEAAQLKFNQLVKQIGL